MVDSAEFAKTVPQTKPGACFASGSDTAIRRFAASLPLAAGVVAGALPSRTEGLEASGPSLFLAGDTILSQPWSGITEPGFREVAEAARAADVAIFNLETVIHTFRGSAQADSGGSWLSAPPEIARELAWGGVDMVSHANNHSFDFGSIGVLENLEFVRGAGIVLAGSGEDLQAARAPGYFGLSPRRVALVSAAATFVPYGRASPSRPDAPGRPGLNPLRVISDTRFVVTPATAERLGAVTRRLGGSGRRFGRRRFEIAGFDFRVGDTHAIHRGERPEPADLAGNLAAVREAAANADVVVFSIHAHSQGSWLRGVAHQVLDAGADVFLAHGPHEVGEIEIYRGKPIFYCLGDFAFQIEQVERHPAETYERFGLDEDSSPDDVRAAIRAGRPGSNWPPKAWEAVAAQVDFDAGRVRAIRLLPLDLHSEADLTTRGIPQLAGPELGRRIIEGIAHGSRRYRTGIQYAPEANVGLIDLD